MFLARKCCYKRTLTLANLVHALLHGYEECAYTDRALEHLHMRACMTSDFYDVLVKISITESKFLLYFLLNVIHYSLDTKYLHEQILLTFLKLTLIFDQKCLCLSWSANSMKICRLTVAWKLSFIANYYVLLGICIVNLQFGCHVYWIILKGHWSNLKWSVSMQELWICSLTHHTLLLWLLMVVTCK